MTSVTSSLRQGKLKSITPLLMVLIKPANCVKSLCFAPPITTKAVELTRFCPSLGGGRIEIRQADPRDSGGE
jgi:hypothetical protein